MNLSSSNARKLEGKRDSGGSGGDNNEQLTQPQPITTSPTIEPLNELMKKLIKEGTMNKEEYEKLLKRNKKSPPVILICLMTRLKKLAIQKNLV